MDNLKFYPCLTEELLEKCGCVSEDYRFLYRSKDIEWPLVKKGSTTLKLSDPSEMWNLKEDGVTFKKKVTIAYPEFLYGPKGIACKNAEIGICIIWTNNRLTQTGHIMPESDFCNETGRVCYFHYSFEPGEIEGDLELSLIMYIKHSADDVLEGENVLMNEEGVTIGEIDNTIVDFDNIYMEFPIEEFYSEKEPLWWIEFSSWEDPKTVDMFTKDSLCLYLNPYYPACPVLDGEIKNLDLLVDILASAYMMMFSRLSEEDLKATRQNYELAPNSICSVLNRFIGICNETDLRFESQEALLKTLQQNLRAKLK